ncbi:RagB/SusD family nutrient uptake outer membrane protein [Dyadobacter psychrotolerans]|uniref:RagB/SusD family nutrient uptake outer membrane protein n=1 Tax=Dyadobacter psychrotolerans TaxID=2541721 RepID=A0A4R5DVW4_9BACT|nr:RagB/SusD family nutrient uptake outer membrane protein [Dyadobacter psychrotolerans]
MRKIKITAIIATVLCLSGSGCKESFLDEVPLDRFSPENLLVDEAGFETAVVALYQAAREEHTLGGVNFDYMNLGTDVAVWGRPDSRGFKDYTLLNSQFDAVNTYWDWAYRNMIRQSNLILDNINKPNVTLSPAAKASFSGQAKFFRAYAYNILATLYGGVPIVESQISEPKFDFQRSTKLEVLQFVRKDLEEAAVDLPAVTNESNGRIYKAAANHLLSEVYLSLGMETGDVTFYDKSIAAATTVISGAAGKYQLMTQRFGDLTRPGDVFSDLFWTNQQNRASGNLEVIWAWQFESFTLGGGTGTTAGINGGNNHLRLWAMEYDRIRTPNAVANISSDSLQRGIGVLIPTNYFKYDIWKLDPKDMRNSSYNIRREFYYDNPADPQYFGKKILTKKDAQGRLVVALENGTLTTQILDTARMYYPWIRKIDGLAYNNDVTAGRTSNDIIVMRLAETYLLRAEAYFRKGDKTLAAADLNTIRTRARAKLITAQDVTVDFILDERARELIIEEPRRRTLARMGVLYDRVRKYNPASAGTIKPNNALWPLPLKVIDSNTGFKLDQNPGYN